MSGAPKGKKTKKKKSAKERLEDLKEAGPRRAIAEWAPEEPTVSPAIALIPEAVEELRFSCEEKVRFLAVQWFLRHAPEILEFSTDFAPTLAYTVENDKNWNVRKVAIDALGALGPQAAGYAEIVESFLKKSVYEKMREAAASALGLMGKESSCFPPAATLRDAALYDSGLSVRRAAAQSLAALAPEVLGPMLETLAYEITKCQDPVLRCRALVAFNFAGEAAEPHCDAIAIVAINDSVVGVRQVAAETIEALGEVASQAMLQFISALQSEDPAKRKAAARALAQVGYTEPPALPELPLDTLQEDITMTVTKKKKKNEKTDDADATPNASPKKKAAAKKTANEENLTLEKSPMAKKKAPRKSTKKIIPQEPDPDRIPSPPPPPTPSLVKAGRAMASMAMYDTDMMVRYRAGEALSSFARAISPEVRQMAMTTMQDANPFERNRASEALGRLDLSMRSTHAKKFSGILSKLHDRPGSRCLTADIVAQSRACAALRDLGTAAQPHRNTLDAVGDASRDPGLRKSAKQTLGGIGHRFIPTPTPAAMADLRRTMSDLRAEADDMKFLHRCCTPAYLGAQAPLLLRAQLYEQRGPPRL